MNIVYKSKAEIEKIRASSRLVAETLQRLSEAIQPGRTTIELDRLAESCVTKHGAVSAFKGYRGFPASVCVSINEEVVHGIPSSSRRLEEGDIVSLDFGVLKDGYYGDAALTVPVNMSKNERMLACCCSKKEASRDPSTPGVGTCVPIRKTVSSAKVKSNRFLSSGILKMF